MDRADMKGDWERGTATRGQDARRTAGGTPAPHQAAPQQAIQGQLFLEVLRTFGQAKLAVTGTSMLASIWPGDILEVCRQGAAEIRPGEVVLFARDGGFSAHRVVKKVGGPERTLLITRGDRLTQPDPPVSPEELMGRVTAILRGGRRLEPRLTFWRKIGSSILSRSEFCTRLLLRLHRVLTPEAPRR